MSPKDALEYIEDHADLNDKGPAGYGYKSEELVSALVVVRNAVDVFSDLLEALQYAVDNPEFKSEIFDQKARAAISKALGETK